MLVPDYNILALNYIKFTLSADVIVLSNACSLSMEGGYFFSKLEARC